MSGPEIPPRFARALSGSPKDIQKAVNAPTFFISDFEAWINRTPKPGSTSEPKVQISITFKPATSPFPSVLAALASAEPAGTPAPLISSSTDTITNTKNSATGSTTITTTTTTTTAAAVDAAPPPASSTLLTTNALAVSQGSAPAVKFYLYLPDTNKTYVLRPSVLEVTLLENFAGIMIGFKEGEGPTWDTGTKVQAVFAVGDQWEDKTDEVVVKDIGASPVVQS